MGREQDGVEQLERVRDFARSHVAPLEDLAQREVFPLELWERMAGAGLLGLYLPDEHGGGGLHSTAFVSLGEAFVRAGGNLGMAAAWFGHSVVARFLISSFGGEAQRAEWLPELARGRATAAVAISEPEAGAHPKRLRARATPESDGWALTGEKVYVTNGLIARVFVVVAITGEEEGRKRFSAFLVPHDAPGLTVQAMPPLDFLRPSQHARLLLDGCTVGTGSLLGERGGAFEAMARPLRDVEDTLNAGPLLGALGYQLDALVGRLRSGEKTPDAALAEGLGGLGARLTALRAIAHEGAERLDASPTAPELAPLALAFRAYVREFQSALDGVCKTAGMDGAAALTEMGHELERLLGLARSAVTIKQRRIGEGLLAGGGRE
jgi:acyl-CoA dehydrogenase